MQNIYVVEKQKLKNQILVLTRAIMEYIPILGENSDKVECLQKKQTGIILPRSFMFILVVFARGNPLMNIVLIYAL